MYLETGVLWFGDEGSTFEARSAAVLEAAGIPHEVLAPEEVGRRWPQVGIDGRRHGALGAGGRRAARAAQRPDDRRARSSGPAGATRSRRSSRAAPAAGACSPRSRRTAANGPPTRSYSRAGHGCRSCSPTSSAGSCASPSRTSSTSACRRGGIRSASATARPGPTITARTTACRRWATRASRSRPTATARCSTRRAASGSSTRTRSGWPARTWPAAFRASPTPRSRTPASASTRPRPTATSSSAGCRATTTSGSSGPGRGTASSTAAARQLCGQPHRRRRRGRLVRADEERFRVGPRVQRGRRHGPRHDGRGLGALLDVMLIGLPSFTRGTVASSPGHDAIGVPGACTWPGPGYASGRAGPFRRCRLPHHGVGGGSLAGTSSSPRAPVARRRGAGCRP